MKSKRYNCKILQQISMTLRFSRSFSLSLCLCVRQQQRKREKEIRKHFLTPLLLLCTYRIASHTISVLIVVVGVHFSIFSKHFLDFNILTWQFCSFFSLSPFLSLTLNSVNFRFYFFVLNQMKNKTE